MASIGLLETRGKALAKSVGAGFYSFRSGKGGYDSWGSSYIELILNGLSFKMMANGYSEKGSFNSFADLKRAVVAYKKEIACRVCEGTGELKNPDPMLPCTWMYEKCYACNGTGITG